MRNTPTRSLDEQIWMLQAESAIRDLVHCYCDSADRRDWARFRSVFHADSTHRHGDVFEGTSAAFADLGESVISQVAESHHQIGNVVVRVAGLSAACQSYFTAHHLVPADASLQTFPHHREGVDEDWWVGGRYFDRLACRNGRWGIVHRTAVHDWERWEPADARGFRRSKVAVPMAMGAFNA